MKQKTRIIACFLMLCLFALPLCCASAAGNAGINITASKFSNGKYTQSDSFKAGEVAVIQIVAASDYNIGGIRFELLFNSSDVKPVGTNTVNIFGPDSDSYFTVKNDRIVALWYTASENVMVHSGDVLFTMSFLVKEDTKNPATKFTASIIELYDGKGSEHTYSKTAEKNIFISSVSIPAAALDSFRKLQTVTMNSLPDIVDAENKFNQFTSLQIKYFKNNYPAEYAYVTTARNRYNQLFENFENQQEIFQQAADAFKTTYSDVLGLTVDTADLIQYKERVNTANDAFAILVSGVKSILKNEGEQIGALLAKIKAAEEAAARALEAKEEAEQFTNDYAEIWNAQESDMKNIDNFNFYLERILSAKAEYDSELADDTKKLLINKGKRLEELYQQIKSIEAQLEKDEKVSQEVETFLKQWIKVTRLNSNSVSLGDKTAIEMMLAGLSELSENAQNILLSQKEKGQALLKQIEGMESVEKTVIKYQTEYLPGETVVEYIKQPAEIQPAENDKTETVVPQAVQKKSITNLFVGIPKIIFWLLGILAVLSLMLAYPIILLAKDTTEKVGSTNDENI